MATADSWSSQPNQSVLNQNGAPSQSFDSFSTGVSTSVGPVSSMDLAQAQQALSQSVEAYLSTLGYSSSVLDIPAQRHAGSVPGLFHEQDLKVNQHAEYGFIPKLVRKTSFDASYPAALQHPKNAGKQGNSPAVKLAALPNVGVQYRFTTSVLSTGSQADTNTFCIPCLIFDRSLEGSTILETRHTTASTRIHITEMV